MNLRPSDTLTCLDDVIFTRVIVTFVQLHVITV